MELNLVPQGFPLVTIRSRKYEIHNMQFKVLDTCMARLVKMFAYIIFAIVTVNGSEMIPKSVH